MYVRRFRYYANMQMYLRSTKCLSVSVSVCVLVYVSRFCVGSKFNIISGIVCRNPLIQLISWIKINLHLNAIQHFLSAFTHSIPLSLWLYHSISLSISRSPYLTHWYHVRLKYILHRLYLDLYMVQIYCIIWIAFQFAIGLICSAPFRFGWSIIFGGDIRWMKSVPQIFD